MSSSQEVAAIIVSKLQENETGLTNDDVKTLFPNMDAKDIVKIINKLIAKRIISLYTRGNVVLYKLEDKKPETLDDAENEDLVVYQIIKDAGNKGIWVRDIRTKSNLTPVLLNKTLKVLENKKLIKSVKTVLAGKKKVYMLYDLEPDSSLTGGAWYNDQDFESEFVDVLNAQCYRYLLMKLDKSVDVPGGPLAQSNMSYATSKEILKYINDLKISTIQLSENDMISILNTLIYDDKVVCKQSVDGSPSYKAVYSLCRETGLSYVPCGTCTKTERCYPHCKINPRSCEYLSSWVNG